jgi:hypothetical protein
MMADEVLENLKMWPSDPVCVAAARRVEKDGAEIERLTAFLHRISGANDNPSCFNPNVEAVLNEWRALEAK